MHRYYLVPVAGKGLTRRNARKPKYFGNLPAANPVSDGMQWLYYGQLPTVLVECPNMDQTTHDGIVANPDVIAFPENINAQLGGNLAAVASALESVKIPSEWLQPTTTYAEILLRMQKLFLFTQRFQAWLKHRVLTALWDNDIRLNQIPGFLLEDIQDVADSLGLDYSGITADMTIRDAVAIMSQRMP